MARPIDADALIAYFEKQHDAAKKDTDPVSGYVAAALRCCLDYFKAIPTIEAVPVVHGRWISVEERLPEVLTPVLVMHRYEPYDRVTIGYRFQPDKRRKPYWIFFAYWMGDDMMHHAIGDHMICPGGEYVTHWMPLPEPPKEDHHET